MKKVKYHYNKNSLRYEKIESSWSKRIFLFMGFLSTTLIFGFIIFLIADKYFPSPSEIELQSELEMMKAQYASSQSKMAQMQIVQDELIKRDNAVYRAIFGADPISMNIRSRGTGGTNPYESLEKYSNGELMIETEEMLQSLSRQMVQQSKSYDEIVKLIKNKDKMLASIPAIMPVADKDLTRVASGYGMRFHPIYKIRKMHFGMDFTAPRGTPIYATGDGVVVTVKKLGKGYGNHVIIDHGYGYKSRYAHMQKIDVKVGQKLNRGEVIGTVGNSGTSTAPHLHYEIEKDGQKINPVNFYHNDLEPVEYERMIEISSLHNQSFD